MPLAAWAVLFGTAEYVRCIAPASAAVLGRYFQVSGWPDSFETTSAISRLRAGFEALYTGARQRSFSRGCMRGNLANEVADHSDAIRGELAEGLDAWSAIVTELVAEAQRAGEISPGSDAAQLGRFIVNAWEGALTRSRVVRGGQPIDDFLRMVFGHLLADAIA